MTDLIDVVPEFNITCNNPDDVVLGQIKQNMRRGFPRLSLLRAVVVGGGPSLAEHVDEIRNRRRAGWHVFALNATHDWLIERGIVPTHHVLYDSREFMADMVKNWRSDVHYLVSSQCHPSVFDELEATPMVTMFHANNYPAALDLFREKEPGVHVLGDAITVGIQAMNIMVMLGYRAVELYGYDSSWRDGQRHAYAQHANADQQPRTFTFKGKEYKTSGAMAAQAESFVRNYQMWKAHGIAFNVVGDGLLPNMWRGLEGISDGDDAERETAKYEAIWRLPQYRGYSPGARHLDHFMAVMKPPLRGRSGAVVRTKIIDFGCGSARATQRLKDMGYDVLGVDFAANCMDAEVSVPFCLSSLWSLPDGLRGDYGYCCDVMEHIPPDRVNDVLAGISRAVPRAYFRISFEPDEFGQTIGQTLHLTVKPEAWWLETLKRHWTHVSVVDGAFVVKESK
jgi:hypothetical protein